MAYIAKRPVRFDRRYHVGETIPGSVIDTRMVERLVKQGRIAVLPDDMITLEAVPVGVVLKADTLEERVAAAEELFGIEPDESEGVTDRVENCLTALAEILSEEYIPEPEDDDQQEPPPEDDAVRENAGGDDGEDTGQEEPDGGDAETTDEGAADTDTGGETDPAKFACPVCGKMCGNKSGLTRHMVTHNT
ncbi:MAG: hypothetical protein FWE80_01885 [Oscillospiraceae bacterium]|nr:hypothetical protein [Oscillospiraceae bacterium]